MARLGDLIEQIRGVSYKPEDLCDSLNEDGIPLLRASNIQDGKLNFEDIIYIDKKKVKSNQYLKSGDILVCTSSGSKELVGKAAFVENDLSMTFGAFCKVIRPKICCPKYIGHFFDSPYYRKRISASSAGANINNIRNEHIDEIDIRLPSTDEQKQISAVLDKVSDLISLRKQQLTKLDELVKARFVELFGDPITNSKRLPTERMELRFNLKAGITTAADDIHDFEKGRYEIPCYGGNGIRGYVKEKSYEGNFPIIGRQGALCGNVQYATGKFHATEHAVLVSLLKDDNEVWVYYLLKLMDLHRYHTGAAQPGLAVKTLNTLDVIVADTCLQDQFAAFVKQTDKSKLTVQQSLDKLELLKKALMHKYFG